MARGDAGRGQHDLAFRPGADDGFAILEFDRPVFASRKQQSHRKPHLRWQPEKV